ncbi:PHD finger protein ING1 isoform X2 [Punica granatum]|uniref:PHD finger protein ING n=1 Tax=Punica granatum TaxID=22663 RepID=A0A6P8CGI1_PUNGR|nr:PHD finger protein ING1 isoform X2 [Punica granatum]
MSFIDEFQADLDALPYALQKKYGLLRDLDKSLEDLKRQNEQRCEQEIEDIKRGIKSGSTLDISLLRFSDEALDEQKHSLRIADEKVALAAQAYEMVDQHIQQLDQYLKKFSEELRRDFASGGVPASNHDVRSGKGAESGRGGRKKTRLATAAAAVAAATEVASTAAAANSAGVDLDLPVDPNEPTYCFCNQVSFGEMVACDNPNCKIEWFHFGCVGLKERPKGKWYCSDCAATRNRRKGR